jgi:NADP-dependent 3-hydroxy acid dehydrogenase YdfG
MNRKTVALVTGASSGIGKACALLLHSKGYAVYGTFFSTGISLENIDMKHVNIADPRSVEDWIVYVTAKEQKIDILINCAGIHTAGASDLLSDKELKELFDVNFFGLMNTIRAVTPDMRARRSGQIINISSIGGRIGLHYQGGYCATKFAVEGITECLRHELKKFRIKVSLIEPGDTATPITFRRRINNDSAGDADYAEEFASAMSIVALDEQNGARPEKVAACVLSVICKKRPGLRYSCGVLMQRLGLWVSYWLPGGMFRSIISSKYSLRHAS